MLEKVKDREKIHEPGAEELEKKPFATGEPEEQESQQTEKNDPARPKKPVGARVRHYVKRHPGRILLGAIVLVLLAAGSALL